MKHHNHSENRLPHSHVAEWEDLAVDYVDGNLPRDQVEAIEAHLRECEACALAIATQREVAALTRSVPLATVPPALSASVLGALAASPGSEPVKTPASTGGASQNRGGLFQRLTDRLVHAPWVTAAVALLVVAVAVAGWNGLRPRSNESATQAPVTASATYAAGGKSTPPLTPVAQTTELSGATTTAPAATSTTAGALTTAAVVTTTMSDRAATTIGSSGTAAGATTSLTYVTGPVTSLPPALSSTTTQATTSTLGITPVLMTVSPGESIPAGTAAADFEAVTSLRRLGVGLWLQAPTYSAIMGSNDAAALAVRLNQAGFHAELLDRLPLDVPQDYVANVLAVSTTLPVQPGNGAEVLVLAVLLGG
jgi:hypothetical protein